MTTRTDLTYAYIKPENGMENQEAIIQEIINNGFEILGDKIYRYTKPGAKKLYAEHEGKPFCETLIKFTCSEEVRALVLKKENAVKAWRDLIGDTRNPTEGTIRHRFQIPNPGHKNVVHGTDKSEKVMEEALTPFPELAYLWE